jgi:membrane-associated phospholipid phosphatase
MPEEETIPDYLLVLLALVLPLLLMIGTGIALGYYHSNDRRHVALDVHSSLCTILIAFGSTAFFTNFFKYYVGYLRPNFYTMCNYDSATMTCNSNDDNIMREARKAFPSGHASASFCGLLCLGLYLAGKVGLNHHLSTRNSSDYHITTAVSPSRQHHAPWRKFAFLSALGGPLFLSTFVAASRVHDNWHHPADVVAGSLIGASSALVAYHLWYVPNLTGEKKKVNDVNTLILIFCLFCTSTTFRYPSIFSSYSGIPTHCL